MDHDHIDKIIEQWEHERPDLDTLAIAVSGRLMALAHVFERRCNEALKPFDLTVWAFDVLAALRRQGKPFQLSPTSLSEQVMLSTGAMTNRIDRLEKRKLVKRIPDPRDRRSLLIQLTPEGERLIETAVSARIDELQSILSHLSESDQEVLSNLLKRLSTSLMPAKKV